MATPIRPVPHPFRAFCEKGGMAETWTHLSRGRSGKLGLNCRLRPKPVPTPARGIARGRIRKFSQVMTNWSNSTMAIPIRPVPHPFRAFCEKGGMAETWVHLSRGRSRKLGLNRRLQPKPAPTPPRPHLAGSAQVVGGWPRSRRPRTTPRVPVLSEVEGSLAFGDRGNRG